MSPATCRIVLVRPRNPLNIGAAARAMANFGFRDLVLVEPYEAAWREARSAVGAAEVLRAARAVAGLADALADRNFVIGTTTGARRTPAVPFVPLPDLAGQMPARAKAAILFGSEKTGLLNQHLSFCHLLVRVPTTAECPSMNLAQAVAVCCYEWARPRPARRGTAGPPASLEETEGLREELQEVLRLSGYFAAGERASDAVKLRQLLLRLRASSRDVATLRGMIAQVRWKLREKE